MRNHEASKKVAQQFSSAKRNINLEFHTQQKVFFRNEGEIKMLSDKGKLRICHWPTYLKEVVKRSS